VNLPLKVEFDKDEQMWRLIIPSEYNRSGKPESKFFRSVDWLNEAMARIESAMVPTSPKAHNRKRKITFEQRLTDLEESLKYCQKEDEKTHWDKPVVVLSYEETKVLGRILTAIAQGQRVVLPGDRDDDFHYSE
jgi:hypothetical protein